MVKEAESILLHYDILDDDDDNDDDNNNNKDKNQTGH